MGVLAVRLVSGMTACWLVASAAFAVNTPVSAPWPGEDSHEQILEHVFGGDFTSFGGIHFTNGTVTAQRVDDAQDQLIPGGSYQVKAHAVFASFDQSFGYLPGSSGGSYQQIISVTGDGYDVTGTGVAEVTDEVFRWARGGTGGLKSSQDADNLDSLDHLVTYHIFSESINQRQDLDVWMLFFEDLFAGDPHADWDYNDLVVRVATTLQPPVPEPASLMLLAGPLAAVVLRRRRRD